jgi:hypothetical protein
VGKAWELSEKVIPFFFPPAEIASLTPHIAFPLACSSSIYVLHSFVTLQKLNKTAFYINKI